MSHLNDRVRDSLAFSNLRHAEELLNELSERDWQHQTTKDLFNRLVVVVKHVLGRMTIVDRNLVTESSLSQLDQPTYYLLDYVYNLSSHADDEEPDIHNGSTLADQVLDAAYNLPVFPIRTTPDVIQKVADQFESEMQSKTRLLEEQFEATTARASTFSDNVEKQERRQKELAAQFEEIANTKTDEVQSSLNGLLENAQNTTDDLLRRTGEATERLEREASDNQANFMNAQQQRDDVFRVTEKQREDEFRANYNSKDSEIDNLLDRAKEMLEDVAGAKTAEHYEELRLQQDSAADRWRWIGVTALIGWLGLSIWVFVYSTLLTDNVDLASFAFRATLVLPILVLATYALRQSGHHRQREEDLSRVRNELMLLWPFINRLPDSDRELILREITPLYFKGGLSTHDPGDDVGLIGRIRDAIGNQSRPRRDE